MEIPIRSLLPFSFSIFLLAACGSFEFNVESHLSSYTQTPTTNQVLPLATPISQEHAAGICGRIDSGMVVITIYPDISDPHFAHISPDQMIKIVNNLEETLQVALAHLGASLKPGGEVTFRVPVGEYLAPGVHLIGVEPCCGATLWLHSLNAGYPRQKSFNVQVSSC